MAARMLHAVVIHWFQKELSDINLFFGKSIIKIDCEYMGENIQYHAHSNYCKRGPWYHWVMVMYEPFDYKDGTSSTTSELPFDMNENPSKFMFFCH